MVRWNHTDPFPNSEVKRCCGDDSMGVALCQNSSMPGLLLHNRSLHLLWGGRFGFGSLAQGYIKKCCQVTHTRLIQCYN